MTDAERTQDIRDRMSIDLCNAIEVLLELAVSQASGEPLNSSQVAWSSKAIGRLRAHREILSDAIKRR